MPRTETIVGYGARGSSGRNCVATNPKRLVASVTDVGDMAGGLLAEPGRAPAFTAFLGAGQRPGVFVVGRNWPDEAGVGRKGVRALQDRFQSTEMPELVVGNGGEVRWLGRHRERRRCAYRSQYLAWEVCKAWSN